jgi:hypothetical protein
VTKVIKITIQVNKVTEKRGMKMIFLHSNKSFKALSSASTDWDEAEVEAASNCLFSSPFGEICGRSIIRSAYAARRDRIHGMHPTPLSPLH